MFLITNNPRVKSELKNIEIEYINTDYIGILEEVRDYVHNGFIVLTHPLYGSVKPNETLYRSVLLKKGESLDIFSLSLIEDAMQTAIKFMKNKKVPNWSDSVKDDFQAIDLDIISNAIDRVL